MTFLLLLLFRFVYLLWTRSSFSFSLSLSLDYTCNVRLLGRLLIQLRITVFRFLWSRQPQATRKLFFLISRLSLSLVFFGISKAISSSSSSSVHWSQSSLSLTRCTFVKISNFCMIHFSFFCTWLFRLYENFSMGVCLYQSYHVVKHSSSKLVDFPIHIGYESTLNFLGSKYALAQICAIRSLTTTNQHNARTIWPRFVRTLCHICVMHL